MKICSICNQTLSEDNFSKDKNRKGGLFCFCKICAKIKREKYKEWKKGYKKKYDQEHKKQNTERMREYRKNNPEVIARAQKKCQQKRMRNPEIRIIQRLRQLISVSIRKRGFSKTSKASVLLGCSFQEVLDYLGLKPCEDAEIDHKCPCSQAQNEEEHAKLQHYTNLQWLSKKENLIKRDFKTELSVIMCETLLGRSWIDKS